jgi:hypothetical protein
MVNARETWALNSLKQPQLVKNLPENVRASGKDRICRTWKKASSFFCGLFCSDR